MTTSVAYPVRVEGKFLLVTSPRTGRILRIPFMYNENCDPTGVVGIVDPTPDANAERPEDLALNSFIGRVVRGCLEDEYQFALLTPAMALEFVRASESN